MNEIIVDKEYINDEIFWNYIKYLSPLCLAKYLSTAKQSKKQKLVINVNDELIDSLNAINKKRIPENENPNKIVDIVEKILGFNKQHKGKGSPSDLAIRIKILTPK